MDQFYTRREVAAACMESVFASIGRRAGVWLEPSAGTGAFLDLLPTPRLGLDLDEHASHPEVVGETDFLKWTGWRDLAGPVVTVGNPPFGRNASLALKFVNRAATFSDHVCMILPRTFEKDAMKEKVDRGMELTLETTLDPFSFIHEGEPYDVPCCFQIWSRMPIGETRPTAARSMRHSDFAIVEDVALADFAFQRVGAKAGLSSIEGLGKSWKSHYYVRATDRSEGAATAIMETLNAIDWSGIRARTAGNPSIGKGELYAEYAKRAGPGLPPPTGPQDAFAF